MSTRHLAVLALLLAPSIPRPTGACSPLPENDGSHVVDPAFAGDAVAPSAVTATFSVIHPSNEGSRGCAPIDCGPGVPHIDLDVVATDDRAPTDRLGYHLTVLSGEPPGGLSLPSGPVLTAYGDLLLRFAADAGGFNFALEVRAVDLNGNVGPPSTITISDPG